MFSNRLPAVAVVGWVASVAVSFITRVTVLASPFSGAELAGWVFLAAAPAAVVLAVFRETAPSIVQVLHDAGQASNARSRS
jgi:hypothetical protein